MVFDSDLNGRLRKMNLNLKEFWGVQVLDAIDAVAHLHESGFVVASVCSEHVMFTEATTPAAKLHCPGLIR